MKPVLFVLWICFSFQNCSHFPQKGCLFSKGSVVRVVFVLDPAVCKKLKPIFGKWMVQDCDLISEEHRNAATNDLRNQAAEQGATHVVVQAHHFEYVSPTQVNVIQQGVAYVCPQDE